VAQSNQGPATDRHNAPVVDPTKNVNRAIKELRREHADAIRQATKALRREQQLHNKYAAVAAKAERRRVNAIHKSDVAAGVREAVAAAAVTQSLAKQVADTAEAMRSTTERERASTAVTLEQVVKPLRDGQTELTRAMWEGAGGKTALGEQRLEARGAYTQTSQGRSNLIAAISVLVFFLGIVVTLLVTHWK
jgi:phage shock protein A